MKMNEPVGQTETIDFKLNGDTVSAWAGETIIQAAKRHGVDIPHLCYKEGLRPDRVASAASLPSNPKNKS